MALSAMAMAPQMLGPKGDAQGGRHDAQQATVTWRRFPTTVSMGIGWIGIVWANEGRKKQQDLLRNR